MKLTNEQKEKLDDLVEESLMPKLTPLLMEKIKALNAQGKSPRIRTNEFTGELYIVEELIS